MYKLKQLSLVSLAMSHRVSYEVSNNLAMRLRLSRSNTTISFPPSTSRRYESSKISSLMSSMQGCSKERCITTKRSFMSTGLVDGMFLLLIYPPSNKGCRTGQFIYTLRLLNLTSRSATASSLLAALDEEIDRVRKETQNVKSDQMQFNLQRNYSYGKVMEQHAKAIPRERRSERIGTGGNGGNGFPTTENGGGKGNGGSMGSKILAGLGGGGGRVWVRSCFRVRTSM